MTTVPCRTRRTGWGWGRGLAPSPGENRGQVGRSKCSGEVTVEGKSWMCPGGGTVADSPILHILIRTASYSLPGVTFPSLDKGLRLPVHDNYQSRTAQDLGGHQLSEHTRCPPPPQAASSPTPFFTPSQSPTKCPMMGTGCGSPQLAQGPQRGTERLRHARWDAEVTSVTVRGMAAHWAPRIPCLGLGPIQASRQQSGSLGPRNLGLQL